MSQAQLMRMGVTAMSRGGETYPLPFGSPVAQDYALFLTSPLGILVNPQPKELGVIFHVKRSDRSRRRPRLDSIKDALSLRIGSGGSVEIWVTGGSTVDEEEWRFGSLKVSDDIAFLLLMVVGRGAQVELSLSATGREVLLYCTAFPLRDWIYGATLLSPAGWVMLPASPEMLRRFDVFGRPMLEAEDGGRHV